MTKHKFERVAGQALNGNMSRQQKFREDTMLEGCENMARSIQPHLPRLTTLLQGRLHSGSLTLVHVHVSLIMIAASFLKLHAENSYLT